MRVLVCGGRGFCDYAKLAIVLDNLHFDFGIDLVIHGNAKGADTLGKWWAERNCVPVKPYPANWDEHGNQAGPIRNQQMLDEGKPDMVVAFYDPDGKNVGTADMVRRARKVKSIFVTEIC